MIFGYANVTPVNHNVKEQLDALNQFGVEKTFTDVANGSNERPNLNLLIDSLRKNDSVIVFELAILANRIRDLVLLIYKLNTLNVTLISIKEKIDSSTDSGKFFLNVISILAKSELNDNGKHKNPFNIKTHSQKKGRKNGLQTDSQLTNAYKAYQYSLNPDYSVSQVCELLNISRSSYYRYINFMKNGNS